LDNERLQFNHSVWLKFDSAFQVPFSSIYSYLSNLKLADENKSAIYFSSTIDTHSLPLIVAAWLKGYALVPISESQPEHLKKLLLEKTKAVNIPLLSIFSLDPSDIFSRLLNAFCSNVNKFNVSEPLPFHIHGF